MHISAPQSDLSEIVSIARAVAKSAPGSDHGKILDHVLLQAEEGGLQGKLTMTASDDMRVIVRRTIPCHTVVPGSVAIHASRLHEAISVLPRGDVSMTVDPSNGYTTLSSGQVKLMLRSFNAAEYPQLSIGDAPGIEVKLAPLIDLLTRSLFAIPARQDLAAQILGCATLISDGSSLTCITASPLMIVQAKVEMAFPAEVVVLQKQCVDELLRIARQLSSGSESAMVSIDEGHLIMRGQGLVLALRLAKDVNPLPVESMMAGSGLNNIASTAVFGRESLVDALRTTRAVMGKRDEIATFLLAKDSLSLTSHDEETGSSSDLLVRTEYAGRELRVGVNAERLHAILSSFTGSDLVTIAITQGPTPFFICPGAEFNPRSPNLAMFVTATPKAG